MTTMPFYWRVIENFNKLYKYQLVQLTPKSAKGMTYVDVLMTNATKNARTIVRDRVKSVYVMFLVITGYVIPIVTILFSYGQILYQLLMNKSIRDL